MASMDWDRPTDVRALWGDSTFSSLLHQCVTTASDKHLLQILLRMLVSRTRRQFAERRVAFV